ncbi:MAG: Nuclear cap-binding protein subunit 1, partial [Paramarteilia canceri]
MNVPAIETLSNCFTHSISNQDNKWCWDNYADYCLHSPNDLRHFFVNDVCIKLIALNYYDKIVAEMPEEAFIKSNVMPIEPNVSFIELIENLEPQKGENIQTFYTEIKNLIASSEPNQTIIEKVNQNFDDIKKKLLLYIALIVDFGQKSITHVSKAISKIFKFFNHSIPKNIEINVFILDSIYTATEHHKE